MTKRVVVLKPSEWTSLTVSDDDYWDAAGWCQENLLQGDYEILRVAVNDYRFRLRHARDAVMLKLLLSA